MPLAISEQIGVPNGTRSVSVILTALACPRIVSILSPPLAYNLPMPKTLEFREDADKRFEAAMRKLVGPTAATPKPEPPARPQSSAK